MAQMKTDLLERFRSLPRHEQARLFQKLRISGHIPAPPPDVSMSLTDFKRRFWRGYKDASHQVMLDTVLSQVAEYILSEGERGISKLMVFMPPRHGKSMTTSVMFPAWLLARQPSLRLVMTGYAAQIAYRHSRMIRNLLQRPDYRELFPHVRLSGKQASAWETSAGGGIIAAGVGGSVTGFGGALAIVDDPVRSRSDAESALIRQRTQDWYENDLLTRVEAGGSIVLMLTRWHHADLAGQLLENEDDWHVLSLPALASEAGDPLERAPGEALWPETYPVEWLEKRREAMGEYAFSSLYQQQPTTKEAGLFDAAKCEIVDALPEAKSLVRFYDLAVSSKSTADYTASVLLGSLADGRYTIPHVTRWQATPATTFERIVEIALRDGPHIPIFLEAENSARVQLDFLLRDERLKQHTIRLVSPSGDKYTRASPCASRWNAGLFLMLRAGWNRPFLDELALFPSGRNDDQIDALSGAYSQLASRASSLSMGSSAGLYASAGRSANERHGLFPDRRKAIGRQRGRTIFISREQSSDRRH